MNLYSVLPDLPTADFSNILPSLERSQVSVSDLLTLEPPDVAKRAQIPVREVTRLTSAILNALHAQYGFQKDRGTGEEGIPPEAESMPTLVQSGHDLVSQWTTISTLDETLDETLKGGIPQGCLTEITGESGAGKTQLLLTLLISAQLLTSDAHALYITTEAPLQTSRLSQMIKHHPHLSTLPADKQPSLSRILSISTPDLESQDHILRYQVPVAIRRHNIRLLVIDSITANYRAEFDRKDGPGKGERDASTNKSTTQGNRSGAASMAKRTSQLMALGSLLRDLARTHNMAIVVANQVADRFKPDERTVTAPISTPGPSSHPPPARGGEGLFSPVGTPLPTLSQPGRASYFPSAPSTQHQAKAGHDPLTLAYQQNFFTGWGDTIDGQNMKTPSLGLVWSNEIAARIALIKTPDRVRIAGGKSRRWLRVVFAPWCAPSVGSGVEFDIGMGGVSCPREEVQAKSPVEENIEM